MELVVGGRSGVEVGFVAGLGLGPVLGLGQSAIVNLESAMPRGDSPELPKCGTCL